MATIGLNEVALATLLLLMLALVTAMLLASGWVVYRFLTSRPILPDRPIVNRRPVPWNLGTVVLVILVYPVVSCEMPRAYDLATGRKPVKPAVVVDAAAERQGKAPGAARIPIPFEPGAANGKAGSNDQFVDSARPSHPTPPARAANVKNPKALAFQTKSSRLEGAYSMTEMMAILALTNLALLILLPLVLRMTSGGRLRDLGLSFEGWPRQVAVGAVAALSAAPFVYSIQFLAIRIWDSSAHPLQKMLLDEFSPGVAELAILSGVILAPVVEELVFRGIFQSWLAELFTRRRSVSPLQSPETVIKDAESATGTSVWDLELDTQNIQPSQSPAKPDFTFGGNRAGARSHGIVLTSLLFAAVHAGQWPAPIALFLLALVIGTVYERTGSLMAAIVLHATFNGLSTVAMFIVLLASPIVDANKVKVGRNEAAVIKSQVCGQEAWVDQFPKKNRRGFF
jgi:membrane protease YdiL (CAAX protease family)